MKYNYHTHTSRCNHAGGSDLQYAEKAYETGLIELGFADHVPQPGFEGIFESWFRMKPHETKDYISSVRELKERFGSKMNILAGFEVEYYPKHFKEMTDHLRTFSPDYLILGQHFTHNEYDGVYVGNAGCDEGSLEQYVKQVREAVKTGIFSYIAHPDLPNFSGDPQLFYHAMKEICIAAKEEDIPIECNLLGIMGGRWYPRGELFRAASEVGNEVILGLDAHLPDSFICEEAENNARRLLAEYGITPIEKLNLRRPF